MVPIQNMPIHNRPVQNRPLSSPRFVFASILQSDHYGKSMHRTITAISHCQHLHNVIHSFGSSTKQTPLCCLIFAQQCVQYFRRFTNRMLVLPQRAQIKSIKQMKFLSRRTQNQWKFVIVNVIIIIIHAFTKRRNPTCRSEALNNDVAKVTCKANSKYVKIH